jgi:hypothetical protein
MKETLETQVCTKCRLNKPLSEYQFRKDTQKHRRDCKDCQSKYQKIYQKANLEKERARVIAWQKANPERCKANRKAWKEANLEKVKANRKAYYEANRERERNIQQNWVRANREKCRSYTAKRRAAKSQATPAWANLQKIQEIYLNCPPGHHIDHVFPLNSPIMCGLHVENNLQYLPAKENISKGNRVTLEEQLNG